MTITTARTAEFDQGLRAYMVGIYNYMLLGLVFSAGAAWLAATTGFTTYMMSNTILFFVLLFAPFGLIFAMAGAERMQTSTMFTLYTIFTILEGLTLSVVLMKYTGVSIATTLLATCGVFAGLSLWGYTTKRDLSAIGTFAVGALFGLIVVMILAMFIQSTALNLLVSVAGVVIFSALIAWDTQKLKGEYASRAFIGGSMQKAMIWGALDLYLDFLNMFLFLLRLMGVSKDD